MLIYKIQATYFISRKLIETARGIKTHKELSESVFEPLGYKIKEETFVPALDYTHEQECSKVSFEKRIIHSAGVLTVASCR